MDLLVLKAVAPFPADTSRYLPQVSVLPGTDDNKHFWDRERIAMMQPSAVFVNIGRGITVDEEALCDALEVRSFSCISLASLLPWVMRWRHGVFSLPSCRPTTFDALEVRSFLSSLLPVYYLCVMRWR